MKTEYFNILVNHSRYRRLVVIMSILILLMVAAMVAVSFKVLDSRKSQLDPERYVKERQRVTENGILNGVFGMLTIAMIAGIAHSKMKSRIITDSDGITSVTLLKKTFIPWKEVKDVKIMHSGLPGEKCRIKAPEKEIFFTAFFVETDRKYRVEKNGIFDEYNNPVTSSVKRSRIYKDIQKRMGK